MRRASVRAIEQSRRALSVTSRGLSQKRCMWVATKFGACSNCCTKWAFAGQEKVCVTSARKLNSLQAVSTWHVQDRERFNDVVQLSVISASSSNDYFWDHDDQWHYPDNQHMMKLATL